ncbi:hypothetical protein BJL95_11475 [Methylomonas sp. LWB]|uniref:TolC family protein n=1 Tax=Methylomonas sp. LWB TaxID=1905845 RepID=UPI0008D91D93|nr:TolC family protein [Methylomonas sp. LWB]OHX36376.1 hypothetical protein BJL95_11475 [Methylomonas sp. LWB]
MQVNKATGHCCERPERRRAWPHFRRAGLAGCCLAWAGALPALDLTPPDWVDPFAVAAERPPLTEPWRGEAPAPADTAEPLPLPDQPLSLAQLTELALRHHPKSRQVWAQVAADAAGVGMAKSAYLPTITLTTGFTHLQPIATSGFSNRIQNRYGPALSLSYVLFDFGKRGQELEMADYRLLAAELNRNRVLQDVALDVERAYYQSQGIAALVAAAKQSLESAEASVKTAEAKRASGVATIGDVYRAKTAQAQARLTMERALGEQEKLRGRLANVVGAPVSQTIPLQAWPEVSDNAELLRDLDGLLQRGKAARPDLLAAEAQVRAARANVGAVSAQGLPSLEFNASNTCTYFVENRPDNMSYNIGVQLKVPLFQGFQNTYAVRQSQAQLDKAEASRDQAQRQIELDVWQAYFDLRTAGEAIDSARSLKTNAERSVESAQARYRSGVGTLLEWLTSEADLANARMQDIQARIDWYVNLAQLTHALGGDGELAVVR